jgi:hypothetical protein
LLPAGGTQVTTQKLYLSRAYAALAWMLAALAVLHMGTTFRLATATAFTKVWFFGAGVAMAQTALFNLLHRAYGRTALAWVTRASNALMLGLAAVGGLVTGASAAELVVMLGALGALLVLSFVFGATRAD